MGGLLELGFQRQGRYFSFRANTQLASQRSAKLGLQPEELAPRQISQCLSSGDYRSWLLRSKLRAAGLRDRKGNTI
ncbi:hypothetical protein GPB2148_2869 [marine gamma proteobacterium HTCC2148]|nr:hypothetical protein GPB2148_2869 [marine gamma proteobacterium HTCC2148]